MFEDIVSYFTIRANYASSHQDTSPKCDSRLPLTNQPQNIELLANKIKTMPKLHVRMF